MQIKNNIIFIIIILLGLSLNSQADEFNISAKKISIDKKDNIVVGQGSVEITDSEGKIITSDTVRYNKKKEFLSAEGSVKIIDKEGNIITSNKITYDKIKNIIISFKNSELTQKDGYKVSSSKILYNNLTKIISSDQKSILNDEDGNIVYVDMFQYHIEKKLFSSIGEVKVIDQKKNKYFFKELHVDTGKKEIIGSDVSVILDQENFGVSKKNDPRFVANDIFLSENKSNLSKGIFTVCQKRGERCPPWSLQAKKISHDKIKKTIYYENATLKVYDVPIFYFPRFFHPDPTVKRQSGFLAPYFTNTTTTGIGFALPYYWAINMDKDLTFTPKIYNNENILLLNEFRQAYKNSFLILDTSFTQGYKNTSAKKTDGSRSHIFANLDINLSKEKPYDSNISFKTERTSNDTYFRVHDINTTLVDSENTNLKNEINYNFSNDDSYLNIKAHVYENLREKSNSRYEYVLPNVLFGKSIFNEKLGNIEFKSDNFYKNYEVNKHLTSVTNDIIWTPNRTYTKNGFVNSIKGMIKNTNYDAKNTTTHKNDGIINELSSVLSFKTSRPMKKKTAKGSNFFSPNIMFRYAPFHMKNLGNDDATLSYSNLYSLNKTSEIEDGASATLGFDFKTKKIDKDNEEQEKLAISMGQVFNMKKNRDMPIKSSLDQKMSDVVGEINYNFSKMSTIGYKFSLDHNFNDLNYNEVSTSLNFGKINFNLEYLEEQNHIGNENYISSGINFNVNDKNSLNFSTKKNFKTDSTEFYNISYQYSIDCLTAGLVYRREFYEDNDIEPKDTLMFQITFVPFTGVSTPSLITP